MLEAEISRQLAALHDDDPEREIELIQEQRWRPSFVSDSRSSGYASMPCRLRARLPASPKPYWPRCCTLPNATSWLHTDASKACLRDGRDGGDGYGSLGGVELVSVRTSILSSYTTVRARRANRSVRSRSMARAITRGSRNDSCIC